MNPYALDFAHYNFCRAHSSQWAMLAMAADISSEI